MDFGGVLLLVRAHSADMSPFSNNVPMFVVFLRAHWRVRSLPFAFWIHRIEPNVVIDGLSAICWRWTPTEMRVSSILVAVNLDSLDLVRAFGFYCNISILDPFLTSDSYRRVCLYDVPLKGIFRFFLIMSVFPLPRLWLGIA